MSDPNQDMLLDALRRVGVRIPELRSSDDLVSVRSASAIHVVEERRYWHVSCGPFDTMVDYRDAEDQARALTVAMDPLQPWYVRLPVCLNTFMESNVKQANHDAYIEWLRRGVK